MGCQKCQKKLVSVTANEAPSMVGKENGVIAFLGNDPDMLEFSYRILHQEQLCSKLRSGELKVAMDSVTKTVTFIMAHTIKTWTVLFVGERVSQSVL